MARESFTAPESLWILYAGVEAPCRHRLHGIRKDKADVCKVSAWMVFLVTALFFIYATSGNNAFSGFVFGVLIFGGSIDKSFHLLAM